MIWRFTPKACPWSTPKRGGARGLACGKGAGVTFPRLRAGACSAAYHSSTLPSNQLSAWCQASAPKSAPALRSPLLQEAVHFLMSVDTLHLPLSCLHLAQSGVLPPAIHFTNTWNDRDTKVTLWHLNCTLGIKKEKNWVLLLNLQLFKDPVWHSFLSQGSHSYNETVINVSKLGMRWDQAWVEIAWH